MAIKTAARQISAAYLALIRRFPLVPIRSYVHLDEALGVIEDLLARELSAVEQAYLDVLTNLVEAYEEKHVKIPRASEADVLRELMRANGLSQNRLAEKTGIPQSTISAVLNGGRSLTRDSVVRLAKFFNVSPGVFLPG